MKAVIFDMDGLMFDTERLVQASWQFAGEKLGYHNFGENIYHTLGFGKRDREAYFKKQYGMNFPFETFQVFSSLFFHRYIKMHGLPTKPGLFELLDYLTKNHYLIALATSSSRKTALHHLAAVGISDYFTCIISGDLVHKAKPDPEIYQLAISQLQIPCESCFALEDSYHGLKAAYLAGAKAIFVPDLLQDEGPVKDFIVAKCASLHEIITYLENH